MKIIAINKSSDVVPYLACICKDFSIDELGVLTVNLDNAPYRTDGTEMPETLIFHPDNYDWVDSWDLDEENLKPLKLFRQKQCIVGVENRKCDCGFAEFCSEKTVCDGFGGVWQKCNRPNCGLSVVRPGKVQCWCDDDIGPDYLGEIQNS